MHIRIARREDIPAIGQYYLDLNQVLTDFQPDSFLPAKPGETFL